MDLANYLVPVNADIADLDAIFVEEADSTSTARRE
jgi:CO/xanthine dehydrogenase Mo-binding subunit